jgi:hypothetical protein
MTAGGTLKLLSYLKKEFWQDVPAIDFPNVAKTSYIRYKGDFVFVTLIRVIIYSLPI